MSSFLLAATTLPLGAATPAVHVWEKQEITLQAQSSYQNPYLSMWWRGWI